ncbi:MAG TPA: tetratricopeptide repeat protein [Candidatus Angelobacter sp.]|nr:tetratricopeptide repeat protein [Candidatus Angelobacter sp.]
MQPLAPPDTFHLSAAVGWLELGDAREAVVELTKITRALQSHPDVLEIRWLIHAHEENWEEALAAARALVEGCPKRSSGWLHRAYALRRVKTGGLQAAWDALRPAFEKFPDEPTVPYNLACYACQMRRLDEARDWLQCAIKAGGKEKVKRMALNDDDLKSLWDEIKRL